MKISKSQLREIIREELATLTESADLNKIADLYAYYGINFDSNSKVVNRYGEETVDGAKKLIPHMKVFEKSVVDMLRKIRRDKMYPIYLQMLIADRGYAGGSQRVSFGDLLENIARKHGIM